MKSLTRYLLFLTAIFFLIVFFFSVFAKASLAEDYALCGDNLTCHATTVGATCSSGETKCISGRYFQGADSINGLSLVCCEAQGYSLDHGVCKLTQQGYFTNPSCTAPPTPTSTPTFVPTNTICQQAGGSCIPTGPCAPPAQATSLSCGGWQCCQVPTNTPTPTPTPNPISSPNGNCGDKNCSSNETCLGTSFDNSTLCLQKGSGGTGSYCGTPRRFANNDACSSGFCDSTLHCASKLVWQQIGVCTAPTNTPIPTIPPQCKNASDCNNPPECHASGSGNAQCTNGICTYPKAIINGSICQLDNGTQGNCSNGVCVSGSPTVCGGTQGNISYQCQAGCLPGQTQAPQFTCPQGNFCCGTLQPTATPTPTPTPGPTATPTPTPLPGSVQLALNVYLPHMIGKEIGENNNPIIKNNRAVKVILKSSTNQTIEKSGIVDYSVDLGKYAGIINLGPVPPGTYKGIVKMGNFLVGRVSDFGIGVAGDPIVVNVGLVVALDEDLNPNIAYYGALVSCFGSTIGHAKCNNVSETDLNSDGAVDVVDYSIFLRSLKEIVVR